MEVEALAKQLQGGTLPENILAWFWRITLDRAKAQSSGSINDEWRDPMVHSCLATIVCVQYAIDVKVFVHTGNPLQAPSYLGIGGRQNQVSNCHSDPARETRPIVTGGTSHGPRRSDM